MLGIGGYVRVDRPVCTLCRSSVLLYPALTKPQVATKYVPARGSITLEGIPTDEGIQELLFSLPRCGGYMYPLYCCST